MRRAFVKVCVMGVLACSAVLAGDALSAPQAPAAKPGRAGKGDDPSVTFTPASLAKLKSDDLTVVSAGMDDARLAGPKAAAAVRPIVQWLGAGLPYPMAEAAIDTLADIDPTEVSAIVPYAQHRQLKVRRAAVRALGKATGKDLPLAVATLKAALSDADPQVRAAGALGLGALKAKASVPDLLVALDRHVYEAAVSVGQLCAPAECDALMARLGKLPFDVVTTGLDPLLFRPLAEVSDEVKVAIVQKVRDVGTREANRFLKDIGGRWPRTGSPKVKHEIEAAVLATMSSPGGGS
jgi:HEAT repeat protein